MRFNNYLKAKIHFLTAIVLLIAVSSCGSSQYANQDNDGIYGTSETPVEQEVVAETTPNTTNDLYYKNYFKEKSQDYNYIEEEEDVVFTDIDEYEGTYSEDATSEETENGNYAGWGQNNEDITINIYSGNSGFGFNNWGYNPYNNWRFGNRWGYAGYDSYWCPPFYGAYYGGWGYSPYSYYGHGFNNPYYNYGYGGRYNGRNTLAYNTGRRGSTYNRRSSLLRSNSVLRNPSRTRTLNNSNVRSTTRRPNTSTTRPTTTRTKPTTTRPSTSRGRPANTTTRTRTKPTTTRSSTSRGRPANTTTRTNTTRSTPSTRSSTPRSSSTRSSGSSTSPRRGRR